MTKKKAIIWLINLTADIGKAEHRALWHYEQALSEIREMLEKDDWIPCSKKKPKIGVDVLIRFERNCAVGFYSNGSWNINSGNGYYTGLVSSEDQPIAWKPLSEPWEGEQDE